MTREERFTIVPKSNEEASSFDASEEIIKLHVFDNNHWKWSGQAVKMNQLAEEEVLI